jgi:hypothetical protein
MRRFGTATILGGLLLLGASWSLSATDTPKVPRPAARRKAVAPKRSGKIDVKLENLYVDSEIGQVFTVNLGRPDQQIPAGESVASLGSVQIYQLGSSEEPPETEGAGQADPADPAASADDDEMEPAPEATDGDEAMEPAADDSSADPAAEAAAPEAVPQTGQAPPQPAPGAAKPPAAQEASKTPPPAPPPIR